MNKIYFLRDVNNEPLKMYNNTWCYKTLGNAKSAAKFHIKSKNKRLPKDQKIKFEDIVIIECDIVEKIRHPV